MNALGIIATQDELDELPTGSVVMCLWDGGDPHIVMTKYSDGWFGFPSDTPKFPLGSASNGETVALLYRPDDAQARVWEPTAAFAKAVSAALHEASERRMSHL